METTVLPPQEEQNEIKGPQVFVAVSTRLQCMTLFFTQARSVSASAIRHFRFSDTATTQRRLIYKCGSDLCPDAEVVPERAWFDFRFSRQTESETC